MWSAHKHMILLDFFFRRGLGPSPAQLFSDVADAEVRVGLLYLRAALLGEPEECRPGKKTICSDIFVRTVYLYVLMWLVSGFSIKIKGIRENP